MSNFGASNFGISNFGVSLALVFVLASVMAFILSGRLGGSARLDFLAVSLGEQLDPNIADFLCIAT
jgi:hypothetical protein